MVAATTMGSILTCNCEIFLFCSGFFESFYVRTINLPKLHMNLNLNPARIYIFPKLQVLSWKIKLTTPNSILNFKWAWQAQFLSYIPQILKKYVFFIDVQMILLSFFDIPYQKSVIWKRAIFIFNSRPSYAGNGQKPA